MNCLVKKSVQLSHWRYLIQLSYFSSEFKVMNSVWKIKHWIKHLQLCDWINFSRSSLENNFKFNEWLRSYVWEPTVDPTCTCSVQWESIPFFFFFDRCPYPYLDSSFCSIFCSRSQYICDFALNLWCTIMITIFVLTNFTNLRCSWKALAWTEY